MAEKSARGRGCLGDSLRELTEESLLNDLVFLKLEGFVFWAWKKLQPESEEDMFQRIWLFSQRPPRTQLAVCFLGRGVHGEAAGGVFP